MADLVIDGSVTKALHQKLLSYPTMKPNKTNEALNMQQDTHELMQESPVPAGSDGDEGDEPLSKTKRKAAMDDLQDLGVTLVGLSKDKLLKLDLPETLLDAVNEAKRITANGATRRQAQYIGRLMRNVDTAPILEQLQRWDGKNTAENAYFHRLENWRARLIDDEEAWPQFMLEYPSVDSQRVRTLIRNARREQAANKPPKSSRELFKLLREITAVPLAESAEEFDQDENDDGSQV